MFKGSERGGILQVQVADEKIYQKEEKNKEKNKLLKGRERGGVLQVRGLHRLLHPMGSVRWQVHHPGAV